MTTRQRSLSSRSALCRVSRPVVIAAEFARAWAAVQGAAPWTAPRAATGTGIAGTLGHGHAANAADKSMQAITSGRCRFMSVSTLHHSDTFSQTGIPRFPTGQMSSGVSGIPSAPGTRYFTEVGTAAFAQAHPTVSAINFSNSSRFFLPIIWSLGATFGSFSVSLNAIHPVDAPGI